MLAIKIGRDAHWAPSGKGRCMSGRQLYAEFVDAEIRAIISLYEEHAPVTVETLWTALASPVRISTIHAMFAGPEIMMGLPPEAQTFDPLAIPNENQTCFPEAGECLWFYQGKNAMKGLNRRALGNRHILRTRRADTRPARLDSLQYVREDYRWLGQFCGRLPDDTNRGHQDGRNWPPSKLKTGTATKGATL